MRDFRTAKSQDGTRLLIESYYKSTSASASRATREVVEAHRTRRQMRPTHTPVRGQASCSLARGSLSSLEAAVATASAVPVSVAADEADQPKPGAVSFPQRAPMRSRSTSLTPGMWRMVELASEAQHVLLRARWDRLSGWAMGGGH
jgi:hypothetical protein